MILSIKNKLHHIHDENIVTPIKYHLKSYNNRMWYKCKYETFTCSYLCRIIYNILYEGNNVFKIVPRKIMEDNMREIPHNSNYKIFKGVKYRMLGVNNNTGFKNVKEESKIFTIRDKIRKE